MSDIDVCLGISGSFEGGDGGPRWDLLSGNFDGMGISVGCLQWNPGTGSIQKLLNHIFQKLGSVPQGFEAIGQLAGMSVADATRFAVQQWIVPGDPRQRLTAQAAQLWMAFLALPESVTSQQELAQAKLDAAVTEAQKFMPFLEGQIDLRTAAFFFDLRVQQGGLVKRLSNGTYWQPPVIEDPSQADWRESVALAQQNNHMQVSNAWTATAQTDPLAAVLLFYATERAKQARAAYVWDALSRRCTIAARQGLVHGKWFDFQNILP